MKKKIKNGTRCAAGGCVEIISKDLLMCRKHWRRVPNPIKRAVLKHYRPGQDITTASDLYMQNYSAAIRAVREKGAL